MRIRQPVWVSFWLLLQRCLAVETSNRVGRSRETSFHNTLPQQQNLRKVQSRKCTLNEQGFYGEPIGSVYEVEYIYEIFVEPGTRISQIRVLVVPPLDKQITESILPSFFDCETRRRLQSQSIEGISWRPQDVVVESGLSCEEPVDDADCYVVKGFFSVFGEGFESMEEVEETVLPVVRESMESDELTSSSEFLVGVGYIGTNLFDLVPTVAPNGVPSAPTPSTPTSDSSPTPNADPTSTRAPNAEPSSTPAPNSEPSSTPAPNSEPSPTEPSDTPAPNAEPTLSPTTIGPTSTFWPTWSDTELPTSSTRAPTGAPTVLSPPSPNGAPVAPPSTSNSTDVVPRGSEEGLDKMEWWSWLLVAVGGAFLFLVCLGLLSGRSSRGPSKRAVRSDDGTDPTHIGTLSKFEQSRQEYIPPSGDLDSFNVAPSNQTNDNEESHEESTENRGADEGGFGFSYGDEDARENDAVVEYEDEEDVHDADDEDPGHYEDDDGGAYEPDGEVYDDEQAYDDEGDDGDYEDEGEGYDDEETYEDEEYAEDGQDYDEQYDDEEEGEEGPYPEDDGLSYDEESYYTEEVEEDGPRWEGGFEGKRTKSL
ncbi:hypothetical protein FisN_17Lh129 [Fistulifera solaris]|uniref:Uncharacterized protein n=1 Tax=Fistulifera solaris TaxID=1519565 RepID=A0A1Z5K8T8_FISSO|nr:hypothetical protein FisN_17Lh129 [Fistulifera solaris]|eukprot:GAX22637.1 hypothetical protein FisN_17Lh129 [Fistulifera solaris]